MFTCCVRHFRPKRQDETADNDCRWRRRDRNGSHPRADNHESDDNPGGLRPPIFYLDSGDSTDTDAPNPLRTSRETRGKNSNVYTAVTSPAKLDPNSQLQRKSKLHNEKLPSFSALDRSKRPRARREDSGAVDGDNTSLVFEPLTFETFRSSSPPLAVIAPLSKSKSHQHRNGVGALGPTLNAAHKVEQGSDTPRPETNTCSQTDERRSGALKESLKAKNCTVVRHQISISKDGGVHFRDRSRINEGYSSDDKVFTSPSSVPSKVEIPTSSPHKTGVKKRPTTLQLPLPNYSRSCSSRNSALTFTDEASNTESTEDSDALTLTENPKSSREGADDSDTAQHHLQLPNTVNPCSLDKCLVVNANEDTNGADHSPGKLSTGGKIPPKKPKRKNPPSNASSVASRTAITSCLESNRERGVSSSESDRHSDVETQNVSLDRTRLGKELLTPPHSFLDHVYAGFDSFDEVNGSLV